MPASFDNSHAQFSKSLKVRLLAPFVLLLLLVTLTLALLSFQAGSHAVSDLTIRLLTEQAERISQVVDRHMYGSEAVLETAFPTDMRASPDISEDIKGMQERFWTATILHQESNDYVYYGNLSGQGFGLKRSQDQAIEIRMRTEDDKPRDIYYLQSIDGTPLYSHTEQRLFDPRQRPWFKNAQEIKKPVWTEVYVDFSSHDLVVTRARQVLNGAGEFVGVVATDHFLTALNHFVRQLNVSEQALTAIVEPNGKLIAASFAPNVAVMADGHVERVQAKNTGNPIFNALIETYLPQLSDIPVGSQAQVMMVDTVDGKQALMATKRITDQAGLDWIAVIVQPYSEVIASTVQLTLSVAIAGGIAVLLAIWIGWKRFGSIAEDIRKLAVSISQFSQGKRLPADAMKREDEIGMLAHSFHAMQQQLFTDRLTGVSNRSALEPFMDRQIALAAENGESVAVLFIDLNKFKPLNDTWGHNNGDLALIETAKRLESLIDERDFLARLGGDEFVIVLATPSDREDAIRLAEQIVQIMKTPLKTLQNIPANENVYLGASVGIGVYPESGLDAESLLHHADQAMYQDKKSSGHQRVDSSEALICTALTPQEQPA